MSPEIVDQIVLVTVHPASEREDEELQRRRHSLRLLGRLDQHRPSLGRFFAPYGNRFSCVNSNTYTICCRETARRRSAICAANPTMGVQRMAERPFYVVISVCTVATFWMAV